MGAESEGYGYVYSNPVCSSKIIEAWPKRFPPLRAIAATFISKMRRDKKMMRWLSNLRMTSKTFGFTRGGNFVSHYAVWIVCYIGFFNQKAALDDIFNNRFQNYQASSRIIKDLTEVHANIYKLLSMISAGKSQGKNRQALPRNSLTRSKR